MTVNSVVGGGGDSGGGWNGGVDGGEGGEGGAGGGDDGGGRGGNTAIASETLSVLWSTPRLLASDAVTTVELRLEARVASASEAEPSSTMSMVTTVVCQAQGATNQRASSVGSGATGGGTCGWLEEGHVVAGGGAYAPSREASRQ
jgi:hypothetical protein